MPSTSMPRIFPTLDWHALFCTLQIKRSGYEKPTPIQSQAWPIASSGRDLVAIASTGRWEGGETCGRCGRGPLTTPKKSFQSPGCIPCLNRHSPSLNLIIGPIHAAERLQATSYQLWRTFVRSGGKLSSWPSPRTRNVCRLLPASWCWHLPGSWPGRLNRKPSSSDRRWG